MNYKADWSFAGLPSTRIRTLSDCPPYIDIVCTIVKQIKTRDIEFGIDPGWLEPVTDALRPLFYIKVGEELADLFYNGFVAIGLSIT